MKIKLIKTTLALAAVSFITVSFADGILEPAAHELWAGPYAGVYFGGGTGNFNTTLQNSTNTATIQRNLSNIVTSSTTTQTTSFGNFHGQAKGSVADLLVGYNIHPRPWLVTGAQLEGNIFNDIAAKSSGNINSDVVNATLVGTTPPSSGTVTSTTNVRRDLSSLLSVIWRGGVVIKKNTLVYGLVGPTEGNFVIPDNPGYEQATTIKNVWKLGISAGAGLEYKWTEHWSFLAEYRYLGFNNVNSSGLTANQNISPAASSTTTGNNQTTNSTHSNFNMNIGKIGIVYRIPT